LSQKVFSGRETLAQDCDQTAKVYRKALRLSTLFGRSCHSHKQHLDLVAAHGNCFSDFFANIFANSRSSVGN